ncbi:hypothetical protein QVN76_07310 [Yersinia rochesterensis]|uniref:hypothetical protein n=1 Tax=Yersinia TaxID=629 RepID=UPI001D1151AB|nr:MULTISPECIES: hypothetical protein [Yersinia]MDN0106699.1 hypothetical protein [Yersinia rochesterensis]
MSEIKEEKGISVFQVMDAGKAAVMAITTEYEGLTHDPDYHRRATIAALKSALVAMGSD